MINVMVIEDRILTLNALRSQIAWAEYGLNPVGFYTNCRDAIANLEKTHPDVIISDIVMPGMDGLSFCEYVNNLNLNIKLIIISAYSKFEYAKKGIQLKVYDFLEKPVDYAVLCESIVSAGELKKREEQMQKMYENSHDNVQESTFSQLITGNKLEDYSKFDYFGKKLVWYMEGGDYQGIQKICEDIGSYIEKYHISKSYLLFFVTDFLSTQIQALSNGQDSLRQDYLSDMEKMTSDTEILEYFTKVLVMICDQKRKTAGNEVENTVRKIESYIQKHYKTSVSLGKLAHEFNISPNYISRIFKEQTGNTLTSYVNDLKIQEAKKLLIFTDKKIQEISRCLGYSNEYYFSMSFKKATGYSPKDYRKQNAEG